MSGKRKASADNADLPKTSKKASPDSTDEVACLQAPTRFVMVPHRVIGDNRLKRAHFQVLCAILRARRSDDGLSIIGYHAIAAATGYTRRYVCDVVQDLIDWRLLGWIDRGRDESGKQLTHAYFAVFEGAESESGNSGPGKGEPSPEIQDSGRVRHTCTFSQKPGPEIADPFNNVLDSSRQSSLLSRPPDKPKSKPKRVANLDDLTIDDELREWARETAPGVNLDRELDQFRDYLIANGKAWKDYRAAFRNWIRKASDFGKHDQGQAESRYATRAELDAIHTIESEEWPIRLQNFKRFGDSSWMSRWGPQPGEDGCRAPADLMREILGDIGSDNTLRDRVNAALRANTGDDERRWITRLAEYADGQSWFAHYGPAPGEHGCLAPQDLVEAILGNRK